MRKRKARLRILKKLSRAPGGNRARQGARLRHDRNLVRRRGSHRPEEQDHPSLGEARHPPQRAPRPAYCLHLHLRRSLPEGGQGRSPDPARLQHRGDELAPGGNRRGRRARRPRPSSWSTKPVGTCRHASSFRPTSPSFCCHRNAPSLTRSKTSGSSCKIAIAELSNEPWIIPPSPV